MLEALLKNQIRDDEEIAGMLAEYRSRPAFFYQKSPPDEDRAWIKPCYPRADYNIDMRYDPERKTSGSLMINVWCTTESLTMPEEIEKRLTELIDGTFYSGDDMVTCAVWRQTDAFTFEMAPNTQHVTAPEVFGCTILFDLMEFPDQTTTDPDPIDGLNNWTKINFPDTAVIHLDKLPSVWRPCDAHPAVYWRFEGTDVNNKQSYAVNWYTGHFSAHVITGDVTERNRWLKAIAERMEWEGEVILPDSSPMLAKQIAVRHGADPLRDGQLSLTGMYGVLAQHRKEYAQIPLNRAVYENLDMEVNNYGKPN